MPKAISLCTCYTPLCRARLIKWFLHNKKYFFSLLDAKKLFYRSLDQFSLCSSPGHSDVTNQISRQFKLRLLISPAHFDVLLIRRKFYAVLFLCHNHVTILDLLEMCYMTRPLVIMHCYGCIQQGCPFNVRCLFTGSSYNIQRGTLFTHCA